VHHQVAERTHVGPVQPEVQRHAFAHVLVHGAQVIGEGGVVERR
jgi:hypothetical protein